MMNQVTTGVIVRGVSSESGNTPFNPSKRNPVHLI